MEKMGREHDAFEIWSIYVWFESHKNVRVLLLPSDNCGLSVSNDWKTFEEWNCSLSKEIGKLINHLNQSISPNVGGSVTTLEIPL